MFRKEPIRANSILLLLVLLLLSAGCAMKRKVASLPLHEVRTELPELPAYQLDTSQGKAHSETIIVHDAEGQEVLLLKAVRDDETGEMVATEVLDAAVITARFRSKAERGGKVDLEFEVQVPPEMLDNQWEMTLYPDLYLLGDTLRLDPLILTGSGFRRIQERGYRRYHRYEAGLQTDSAYFVREGRFNLFVSRNGWAEDGDTTTWSDASSWQETVDHYTRFARKRREQRRIDALPERFAHWVKVPILEEGVKMDSVVTAPFEPVQYTYVQSIRTRPNLKKINLVLSGEITRQQKHIYSIPSTDSLTFYISTLSGFTHDIVRYKKQIIYRRAEANASCHIVFPVGKDRLRPELGNNEAEIRRIEYHLRHLLTNDAFDLDSVVVTAFASPDGEWKKNAELSLRRSATVSDYFGGFMEQLRDSLAAEAGFSVGLDGSIITEEVARIPIRSRSRAENWEGLDRFMATDSVFTDTDRERYSRLRTIREPDRRELALRREPYFPYVRDSLYPRLRVVTFDFHLHRKGMVKDTVETTQLDDVYAAGVQALRDRDYETAMELLAPYDDYNTAVAYLAMDRNFSALQILEKIDPRTPEIYYLLALLKSRTGDIDGAVQDYWTACQQDPSFVTRGNLDPEISALVKAYGLDKRDDDDDIQLDF